MKPILLSMCYSQQEPGKWLKPVGYHCFCFDEASKIWRNVFKTATQKLAIWNSQVFEGEDLLQWLKDCEAQARIGTSVSSTAKFELNRWPESLL